MSFMHRAWLYVARKKLKSLIVLAILLVMATIMLSGFAIKHSTDHAAKELDKTLMTGATLGNNQRTNPGTNRGSGTVSSKDINAVKHLPGVTNYVARQQVLSDFPDTKLVSLPDGTSGYDTSKAAQFGNAADVLGVNTSELENKFRAGSIKLTSGRHIKPNDTHKILVHEKWAQKNGRKLGDTFTLKANPHDIDNRHNSTEETTVQIVGMFSGTNPRQATYQVELFENLFFTDIATTRTLSKDTEQTEIYQDATFFTKGSTQLDELLKQAEKLPVNWRMYQLTKNSQELAGVTGAVKGVYSLIDGMLIATGFFSIVIISLVLFLWMNERKREAGVLLATGVSKSNIVLQYIAEIVMIAVIAFGASFFTAGLVAQHVGDHIVNQAAHNAKQAGEAQLKGASLGANADSVISSRTLEKVSVQVVPSDLVAVWSVGLIIIIAAVLLASRPVTQSTPKELLTEVE